jgi:hypothetical protein
MKPSALQVQRRRQVRVPQPGLARPQRVLPAAEVRQALVDEALQRMQRLLARDGPGKAVERSGVLGEALPHECDDLACDLIGLEARALGHRTGATLAEGLAVVGVEVPLPAERLVAVHQHRMLAPHLAVEVLHAQLLAAFRMRCELVHGGKEMAVFADVEHEAGVLGHGTQRRQHAGITGCGHHQRLRLELRDQCAQRLGQCGLRPVIAQALVVQRPTGVAQRLREVPHRRQKDRDARLARPDMRRLFGRLGHPHGVARGIETVEGRSVEIKLVAENDDEVAHLKPSSCGRPRSSSAPRPSSLPTRGASSSAGRRRRRACSAARPCCL